MYINLENVVSILNFAMKTQNAKNAEKCYKFLDYNALDFVTSKHFQKLSESALIGLLRRDTFAVDELKILIAANEWYEKNHTADKEKIKRMIRFSLIEISYLTQAATMALGPDKTELEAIQDNLKNQKIDNSLRGPFVRLGSKVIKGASIQMYFDNDWHETIQFDENKIMIIEFETACPINHITFNLEEVCGYGFKVSKDGIEWKKVVDYLNYDCRNKQNVYFKTELIKFIKMRLIGSCITDFFAQALDLTPPIDNGFICPTKSFITNVYINGTCQLISNGFQCLYLDGKQTYSPAKITFNQPYLINSISFDCKGSYKFSIKSNGKILLQQTSKFLQGFCSIQFKPTILTTFEFVDLQNENSKKKICIKYLNVAYC